MVTLGHIISDEYSRPKLNVIELALFAAFVGILAYNGGVVRTRFQWQPYLSREGYELKILENRFGRHTTPNTGRNGSSGTSSAISETACSSMWAPITISALAVLLPRDDARVVGVAIDRRSSSTRLGVRPPENEVHHSLSGRLNREATLYVPSNDLIASASPAFVEAEDGTSVKPVKVNTTTLDDILERSGISRIDFLSIDVELHEPEVLRGFQSSGFSPAGLHRVAP